MDDSWVTLDLLNAGLSPAVVLKEGGGAPIQFADKVGEPSFVCQKN